MSAEVRRVFFLTGAASGIGKHLAQQLLLLGHRVYCTDIDISAIYKWIEDGDYRTGQVAAGKLDVRQPLEWKRAIDDAARRFGVVDVVMNIAGFLRPGKIEGVAPADVDMHLDVNVKGVIFGTREAAARMVDQGHGHIINIGSLASLSPVPGMSLYSASKFAVRGFSLSVAEELRSHNIDVSVVLLDAVRTPMLDRQAEFEEAALTFSGQRPLTLEEVDTLIFDEVLRNRPLEAVLPRGRGIMARLAGLMPQVNRLAAPLLIRRGLMSQQEYESSEE